MTTFNWPGFGIAAITPTLDQPAQVNRSAYTGVRGVASNPWHGKWSFKVQLGTQQGDVNFQAIRAFFTGLKGPINNFHLPAVEAAQNANTGVTLSASAAQGATSLALTGVTTALVPGNMVTIAGQLLSLTSAGSLSGGAQTINFMPALRAAASSGASIETAKPYALVALTDSSFSWDIGQWRRYGLSFTVDEDVGATDGADPALDVWTAGIGGSSSGTSFTFPELPSFITRSLLAAVPSPTDKQVAYLTESGRSGVFVFTTTNVSTLVTADTAQGIYVAPASDTTGASGAWVRDFTGPHLPGWYGNVADDDDGSSGTNNASAWAAMEAVVVARSKAGLPIYNASIYQGGEEILVVGRFYLGTHTVEPLTTFKLRGVGGKGGGAPSRLRFAAGTTGLRAQSFNTSGGSTVDGTNHFSGDWYDVEDIYFLGAFSGTESETHGCHIKRPIAVRNCTFDNFAGDGAFIDSTTGLPDLFRFENCRFINNRDGARPQGGDANAGSFIGCEFNDNRRKGFNGQDFLGTFPFGCHASGNGITSYSSALGASVVSNGGNRYAVADGQETTASTTAPTGTADVLVGGVVVWYFMAAGGVNGTAIPAWVSGMSLRAGGPYFTNNANATTHISACYSEAGQGPSQLVAPATVSGGTHSAGVKGTGVYWFNYQGWWRTGNGTRGGIFDGSTSINLSNGGFWSFGTSGGAETIHDAATGDTPIYTLQINGVTCGQLFGVGTAAYYRGSSALHLGITGTDIATVQSSGLDLASGKAFSINGTTVLTGQMAHIANLSAAPTAADFNGLLAALQGAGLMA